MLRLARTTIVRSLWEDYLNKSSQMQQLNQDLQKKGLDKMTLDHFAIIDLPGPETGIPILQDIFSMLGYVKGGNGYLADKQNDFLWMAEKDSMEKTASCALPQVVVADFRLEEMPADIRCIIEKYSYQAPISPINQIKELMTRVENQDVNAMRALIELVIRYCTTRDWPLPTVFEYEKVYAFNPLLAWVLVFGRTPNHFTLSLHHLALFENIADFHDYVENELNLPLNQEGGKIKGCEKSGLMQGSTMGTLQEITLHDGSISLPTGFVEFVWRFSLESGKNPMVWQDYFTGFVAKNADKVIESLTNR